MIAEPIAILTVEHAHLAPGFVHPTGLRRSQFREITIPKPSLQLSRLRCCSAAAIPRASDWVSFNQSQDLTPSLQLETFRW